MIYSNFEPPVAGTFSKVVTLLKPPSESHRCRVWFSCKGWLCGMKISPSNVVRNRGTYFNGICSILVQMQFSSVFFASTLQRQEH